MLMLSTTCIQIILRSSEREIIFRVKYVVVSHLLTWVQMGEKCFKGLSNNQNNPLKHFGLNWGPSLASVYEISGLPRSLRLMHFRHPVHNGHPFYKPNEAAEQNAAPANWIIHRGGLVVYTIHFPSCVEWGILHPAMHYWQMQFWMGNKSTITWQKYLNRVSGGYQIL